jgi:ABC-type multidrug transport system fused ATPase/permease subunit
MILQNSTIATFIRNNKSFLVIALIAGVIGSISTIFISLSIGSFYQLVFNHDGNKSRILSLIGFHAVTSIYYFFVFYAALLLIKAVSDWLFNYFSKVSATKLSRSVRDSLFEHQLKTRYDLFSKRSPAKYLLRYSGDLQAIQNFYVNGILIFAKDIALLLMGFYFLFEINMFLAFIFLGSVPVLFFVNYLFNIPIRKLITEKRNQKSDLLSFVSHCFHAILSVKAFRKEGIEAGRFQKKSEKLYYTSVRYLFHYAFVQSVAPVLLYSVIGMVLFMVAAHQIKISYGDLMAFVLISMLQLSALKRVLRIETTWRSGNVSIQKINLLLNAPTESRRMSKSTTVLRSMEFENILLGNTATKEHLLNIRIKQGTINYLSCRNSEQLIRILLGVESTTKNAVFLNDKPIAKFTPIELRRLFSFSSDYLPLYGRDLYDMIARGKKTGRAEAVEKLLQDIGFDFSQNPSIVKTSLERKNILLSVQDRKLISLARAILLDTPVLILDKPFDGLNEEIAFKCTLYLKSLLPEKTILIISNAINEVNISRIELSQGYLKNLS